MTEIHAHHVGAEFGHDGLGVVDQRFVVVGRQRELFEKTCLFLGSNDKTKKQIENLYRTRSGLIHGGMNFPFSYCDFDGLPDWEAWMNKATALQDRSVPILVATLQRMAQEGIYSIEFEYKLKAQHTATAPKPLQKRAD